MQSTVPGCEDSFQTEIVDIPLTVIQSRQLEIRSNQGDLSGLRDSILHYGLLSPILVRNAGQSRFEVVVGNRRLKAIEGLGISKIPAKVIKADDRECFTILLTENIQRETLDPIDEARAFYNYICSEEKHGFGFGSITDLANRIGKSQEYVSNRIRLLRLPDSILRQLLQEKKLTISHIEELAAISENHEAVKELADLVTAHRISVRTLEKAVQLIKSGLEPARALDLAQIESEMRLESSTLGQGSDLVDILMRRTKKVLEATLAYLDNTSPELAKEPGVYKYWLNEVRRPIHKAIDGIILCQKKTRTKKAPSHPRGGKGKRGVPPSVTERIPMR